MSPAECAKHSARAAIVGIGLPSWVLPGALIVAGLGLPAILFTAFVQHAAHRALIRTPTLTPGGTTAALQQVNSSAADGGDDQRHRHTGVERASFQCAIAPLAR